MSNALPARPSEEPGAVVPHAGICEGAPVNRRPYLNRPTKMRPLLQKRLLRVAGFVLLPLFCLTCLLTCSVVNPMGLAFLTSFEVVNSTHEDLVITPIGARGPDGRRGTLPISSSSRLYVMSSQRGEFPLPAGSTLSLTYDWDDVQFSEIVCRRPDGSDLVLPTGLHPTQGQYRQPPTKRFEISDLAALQPATELHLAAVRSQGGRIPFLYILAGLGLLSPLCFWAARRIRVTDSPPPLPA